MNSAQTVTVCRAKERFRGFKQHLKMKEVERRRGRARRRSCSSSKSLISTLQYRVEQHRKHLQLRTLPTPVQSLSLSQGGTLQYDRIRSLWLAMPIKGRETN